MNIAAPSSSNCSNFQPSFATPMNMKPISTTILLAYLFPTTAWYIFSATKINRWHFLAGSIHKSAALFLAKDEECSATPKNIPISAVKVHGRTSLMRKPKKGDIVTFTLHKLEPTKNQEIETVFDTSGTLQLMMHSGHYIPSLHDLLSTMSPGETVKSTVIDAGYGPYRDDLKITIPTAQIGDVDTSLVKIGTKLAFGEIECSITSMNGDEWICDANHPLAGMEYEVDVTLDSVEQGIEDWGFLEEEGDINGRYKVATFALGCFWGGGKLYLFNEAHY